MKTPPTWDKDWKKLWEWLLSGGHVVNVGSHKGVAREKIGAFIESLLTSNEAAIRKEIGERIEEIRRTHYIHGAFIKHKNILDDLLALINPTP